MKNKFKKQEQEENKNKKEILTVPGLMLKLANNKGASVSEVVSSFSPGGTNNELHNRDDDKLFNNNF